MKRIGEDVSEKLDYTPGVFTVERHIRGKWACSALPDADPGAGAGAGDRQGDSDGRAAGAGAGGEVPGSPAAVSAGRDLRPRGVGHSALDAGAVGRSLRGAIAAAGRRAAAALLGRAVLHADETPVAMLDAGDGKTHRAYVWSYGTTQFDSLQAVVYDFVESRAGKHAQAFLGEWSGTLVCDDFSGYKALFRDGVTEAGCMAHARRKFHELWANHQ